MGKKKNHAWKKVVDWKKVKFHIDAGEWKNKDVWEKRAHIKKIILSTLMHSDKKIIPQ